MRLIDKVLSFYTNVRDFSARKQTFFQQTLNKGMPGDVNKAWLTNSMCCFIGCTLVQKTKVIFFGPTYSLHSLRRRKKYRELVKEGNLYQFELWLLFFNWEKVEFSKKQLGTTWTRCNRHYKNKKRTFWANFCVQDIKELRRGWWICLHAVISI